MENTVIGILEDGQHSVHADLVDPKEVTGVIKDLTLRGYKPRKILVITTLGDTDAIVLYNSKGEHQMDITIR